MQPITDRKALDTHIVHFFTTLLLVQKRNIHSGRKIKHNRLWFGVVKKRKIYFVVKYFIINLKCYSYNN